MIFLWRGAGLVVLFAPIISYFLLGLFERFGILTLSTQNFAAGGLLLAALALTGLGYRMKFVEKGDDSFMMIPVFYWGPIALIFSILLFAGVFDMSTVQWEIYFDSFRPDHV